MRSIVKSTIHDVEVSNEGNHSGAGRPFTYPKGVENELVAGFISCWIYTYPYLC